MGGTITAASRPGSGTTVTVTVPAAGAALGRRDPVPEDTSALAGGEALLVARDSRTRALIGNLLVRSWRMRISVTASPETALRWSGNGRRYDAVILDHRPPRTDGLALARALRATPAGEQVPIVLITSFARLPGPDTPPGVAVVTRPIRPAPLFRAITTTAARPAAGTPSVAAVPPASATAPAAPAAPDPPATAALVGAEAEATATAGAGAGAKAMRILVADDHAVNQRLVLLQLGGLGHRADLVSSGAEAVAAVRRRHYDVVFMDVHMPDVDGLDATRQIRAHCGGRGPWIIALTADTQAGAREACLAAGMDDYLTKPLVAPDLLAALARAHPPGGRRPVLDPRALERLSELLGGDTAALSGLITDFLTEAPRLVDALSMASSEAGSDPGATPRDSVHRDATPRDSGHRDAMHRAAHTLKGLGATFGATGLARLCEQVETHTGAASEVRPLVREIAAEHERVAGALRAFG